MEKHFEGFQGTALLGFHDLKVIHTFGFLLDRTQKDRVTEITKKVMSNVHVSLKTTH